MDIAIAEIEKLIREKRLDPAVLTEALIERISKYNRYIKSYVRLNPQAIESSKKIRNTNQPVSGIPFSIKDLIDTKGITTQYGSKIFQNHIPIRDAKVVTEIKRNGGIVLGKTNTHQFALGLVTPPTKNPWDLGRIPGGSSGGAAAAVSADLALAALGTDTGGSIRIPASMCGVTGLKPTYGKISTAGVFPNAPSMDHVGPICRFASDLPLLLESMGYKVQIAPSKRALKVGIIEKFVNAAEKNVRSVVRKCLNTLASEGFIEADEIALPEFSEACLTTETIDTYETAKIHKERFLKNPGNYQKTARGLIGAGLSVTPPELKKAKEDRSRIRKEFASLMKKYPILIFPTLPIVAPNPEEIKNFSSSDYLPMVRPLEIFDLLGYPALSVPCGFANGLPVGVHFSSFSNLDRLVIELAIKYQEISSWHTLVPHRFRGFVETDLD